MSVIGFARPAGTARTRRTRVELGHLSISYVGIYRTNQAQKWSELIDSCGGVLSTTSVLQPQAEMPRARAEVAAAAQGIQIVPLLQ